MGGKGSGGKNRKTDEQKLVEGNRGRRALTGKDRHPSRPGEPPRPSCLTAEAAKVWPEICEILERNKVLFDTDGIAIAALCSNLVIFRQADAAVHKFGIVIVDEETGVGQMNPAVRVRSDAQKHLRAGWQSFGLDPVSRSGLDVVKKPKEGDQPESSMKAILNSKVNDDVVM
jgi:P27 family predicted phage terminase small subunit